jgi:hypothetical protein
MFFCEGFFYRLVRLLKIKGIFTACPSEYIVEIMKKEKILRPKPFEIDGSVIFEGDSLQILSRLPSESVQCVVTSPPYLGASRLRYRRTNWSRSIFAAIS